MPVVNFETLNDRSTVWIFASPEPFGARANAVQRELDRFLESWDAHGAPVAASARIVEDRFIVVSADEAVAPGGCSIDRLFRLMKDLEQHLGLPLLDSSYVFYREGGETRAVRRDEFRNLREEGKLASDTIVYDTMITSLGAFRSGWEKPLAQSWHSRL